MSLRWKEDAVAQMFKDEQTIAELRKENARLRHDRERLAKDADFRLDKACELTANVQNDLVDAIELLREIRDDVSYHIPHAGDWLKRVDELLEK